MATPEGRARMLEKLREWELLMTPALVQFPAVFQEVFASRGGFGTFLAETQLLFQTSAFSDSELQGALRTRLEGHTNLVNRATGSTVTWNPTLARWQAGPLPVVPTFAPPTFPEPTPEQVAAFGPGVISEEEAMAELEAVRAAQAPVTPVPTDSPPPVVLAPIPTSQVSSAAVGVQPAGTLAEVSVASKPGPAPALKAIPVMAANTFDPSFIASTSTSLPTTGGLGFTPQISADFDPVGAILGVLGGIQRGEGVGQVIGGGLVGGGLLPTPGIAPGMPVNGDKDLEQRIIDLLKGLPAIGPTGPARGVGELAGLLKEQFAPDLGGVSFPTNGAVATTGLPIAPVVNTTMTPTHRAPKGYVVVEVVGSNGVPVKVAMWKPLARSLKLWKSRPKARITASEWKTLSTAKRVSEKVKKTAQTAGFSCSVKGRASRRASTCK